MKVYVVQGLHPFVLGCRTSVHASHADAVAQAASLVNSIARTPVATADNWEAVLAGLQDEHGAMSCDVSISDCELKELETRGSLASIRAEIRAFDDALDDKANDGINARPPNGDDYNTIYQMVMHDAPADPLRDAAPEMLQALKTIAEGSEATGRWLDQNGAECAESDPGAQWSPYNAEELDNWILAAAETARAAIARAEGR